MLSPAEEILDARKESHRDLSAWMGWAQEYPTMERVEDDLREAEKLRESRASFRYDVFKRVDNTPRFIGSVGIIRAPFNAHVAEIGYWMRTSEQGKGHTKTAAALLATVLRHMGVYRIEIRTDAGNEKSVGVARSLEFNLDGILRGDRITMDGRISSTCVFSVMPNEIIAHRLGDVKYRLYCSGTPGIDETHLITTL
jgi:RimJ/RimL family protein N-acetyltransferase